MGGRTDFICMHQFNYNRYAVQARGHFMLSGNDSKWTHFGHHQFFHRFAYWNFAVVRCCSCRIALCALVTIIIMIWRQNIRNWIHQIDKNRIRRIEHTHTQCRQTQRRLCSIEKQFCGFAQIIGRRCWIFPFYPVDYFYVNSKTMDKCSQLLLFLVLEIYDEILWDT